MEYINAMAHVSSEFINHPHTPPPPIENSFRTFLQILRDNNRVDQSSIDLRHQQHVLAKPQGKWELIWSSCDCLLIESNPFVRYGSWVAYSISKTIKKKAIAACPVAAAAPIE